MITLVTGCTSGTAYIIARKNTQYVWNATSKIAIADQAYPREEDQGLRQVVLTALLQQGLDLVAPGNADYTLAYWIDESWKTGKKLVTDRSGYWWDPIREPGPPLARNIPPILGQPGFGVAYREIIPQQRVVDAPYAIKGIRLKLIPRSSLQTAWDGYIEAGTQVAEDREPLLLRTLLNYLGKDFVGRAKLVK
jgi:hypothetical protein